jgi:hypothetical protein
MDGKDLAEMGEIEGVTRTLSAKSKKSTKGCACRSDTAFGVLSGLCRQSSGNSLNLTNLGKVFTIHLCTVF